MKTVAFDIDDTIWKITKGADGKSCQVPDYELIQVLKWFYNNGDKVYIWSAGGIDYAKTIANKLGLDTMVEVISKGMYGDPNSGIKIDLCFDDEKVNLATTNIRVKRKTKKIT